eukprot:Gb_24556 [translate_table: standard]
MDSEQVRLIIWGIFGCFGFILFLFILKAVSRLESAKEDQHHDQRVQAPKLESLPSRKRRNPMGLRTERSAVVVPTILRDLSLAKLQAATDHFNALNLIKIGRSGDFFAGVLDQEEQIVVKRMAVDELKMSELQTELEIYGAESDNRYLVPLIGQCSEGDQKLLVYKFIANGDLASALAKGREISVSEDADADDASKLSQSLPWITRLKIAVEAAQALFHLHYNCNPPILHKDIKSSSILLTDEYEVRLGSLSYAQKVDNGALLSYDIFCFGKVLLDLISGLDISGSEDPYAEAWLIKASPCIDSDYKDGLLALIDPSLIVEEDFTKEILGVATLAKACLDPNSLKSLNMNIVCQVLQNPQHLVIESINAIQSHTKATASLSGN